MSASANVGSASASGVIVLTLRSVASETAHDDRIFGRLVTMTFPPVTVESYAGVNVSQCCPSPYRDNSGWKKYGWLKSSRTPRSSDDHRACAPAERAPPRKLT